MAGNDVGARNSWTQMLEILLETLSTKEEHEDSQGFPQFNLFPAELRHQIWQEAARSLRAETHQSDCFKLYFAWCHERGPLSRSPGVAEPSERKESREIPLTPVDSSIAIYIRDTQSLLTSCHEARVEALRVLGSDSMPVGELPENCSDRVGIDRISRACLRVYEDRNIKGLVPNFRIIGLLRFDATRDPFTFKCFCSSQVPTTRAGPISCSSRDENDPEYDQYVDYRGRVRLQKLMEESKKMSGPY